MRNFPKRNIFEQNKQKMLIICQIDWREVGVAFGLQCLRNCTLSSLSFFTVLLTADDRTARALKHSARRHHHSKCEVPAVIDSDELCAKCVNTETAIEYNFRLLNRINDDRCGGCPTDVVGFYLTDLSVLHPTVGRAEYSRSIVDVEIIGIDYSGRDSAPRSVRALSSRGRRCRPTFQRQISC